MFWAWLMFWAHTSLVCAQEDRVTYVTGSALNQKLQTKLSVTWNRFELREALQSLQKNSSVSIWLDRRVNPNQKISLTSKDLTIQSLLQEIATLTGTQLALHEKFVYLGPPHPTGVLRTLIKLKEEESRQLRDQFPGQQQFALLKDNTLQWDDLTPPQSLLRKIAEEYTVDLENPEIVPHDLWAGGTLPRCSFEQQLLFILIQFDLSYEWKEPGVRLELVPLPENIRLTREYRVPNALREILEEALAKSGQVEWKFLSKSRLEMSGSLEQHEWLKGVLSPKKVRPNTASPQNQEKLAQRRFTISQKGVPVHLVMGELEKNGIQFEYDPGELEKAEIQLKSKVDLSLDKAEPDQLFTQLFGPLGLKFEINGNNVRLTPGQTPENQNEVSPE